LSISSKPRREQWAAGEARCVSWAAGSGSADRIGAMPPLVNRSSQYALCACRLICC